MTLTTEPDPDPNPNQAELSLLEAVVGHIELDATKPLSRADRMALERAVLAEAELVFCTCSAAADSRLGWHIGCRVDCI